jgi:ketosteroid isomerase-like protein
MTPEELLEGWQAAWSGRDPEAFATVCRPDVHYEDPLTPEPFDDPAAIGRHAQRLWQAFPDVRMESTGPRLADGRHAVAPVKLLGTHTAPLGGDRRDAVPPTGRFVVLHGVFFCEIAEERLFRIRAFFDLYDACVQMGILPGRGTLGERALMALRGFGMRAAGR